MQFRLKDSEVKRKKLLERMKFFIHELNKFIISKNDLLVLVTFLKHKLILSISIIFLIFPIQKNKIVICNFYGNGYGDNGKYIAEELQTQKIDCNIVWLVRKKNIQKVIFPPYIHISEYGSLHGLYDLATAKIWIDNSRKSFYPIKRKGQYYLQTWHSSIRLKKIERDCAEKLSKSYVYIAQNDAKLCDLMISGSDFSWNIYHNSFWYNGEILKSGTPRCDIFFQQNFKIRKKVYRSLNIASGTNLILYAPTFRTNSDLTIYKLEFDKILKTVEEKFDGDWKVLFRLHPDVAFLSFELQLNDSIIDVTEYDDIQELLCAANLLITDYSSCMFDALIAKKICFLHTKDYYNYILKERELYFNFEDLPFPWSITDEQLIINIKNFDLNQYMQKLNLFNKKINIYEEGNACKIIVEKLYNIMDSKKNNGE